MKESQRVKEMEDFETVERLHGRSPFSLKYT